MQAEALLASARLAARGGDVERARYDARLAAESFQRLGAREEHARAAALLTELRPGD